MDAGLISELTAFMQVLFIDLVLAGDNAIVVGMAAASVPLLHRRKVILLGITAAVVMRIAFAVLATKLLAIIGLTLAGGLLLAWVCWKMWRDLRSPKEEEAAADLVESEMEDGTSAPSGKQGKSVMQAVVQVAMADLSMSIDNVLAVAGAAGDHTWVLVSGLILSVVLMGVAATYIAKALTRYHWIGYLGLAMIVWVSLHMIWRGGDEVLKAVGWM
ncbi:YjbE family putative metal transport protein [Novispirillum itersonii]|uniref:YjbE family putative metal transport protein n=1 Tax=Novispirillum itersonii TaxID=189 RepID=UPI00037B1202|nr:YjbE family putative metal transport protein [Novispirillum itersonii]